MPLALVHEGTLVHAVSVLALWCNRFTTEVPKKLTDWFKKVFSLKTSTSAVRHAYLQCMLASFRGKLPPSSEEMAEHTPHGLSLWIHLLNFHHATTTDFPVVTVAASSLAGFYSERTYTQNLLH